MLYANSNITVDPAWPWSLPALGSYALGGAMILLAGITIWTYFGVRGASWGRIAMVLALRLAALFIAFIVVLRPAIAFEETKDAVPSRLFFLVDYSESMNITDDFNNLSRWDNAQRILATPIVKAALEKLTENKVELVYYQGADDLRRYEPGGKAN